jgi:hypothetical protein
MKTKQIDWRVLIAVIISITILEAIALLSGINGTLFSLVMVILGGIAGVTMPQLKTK